MKCHGYRGLFIILLSLPIAYVRQLSYGGGRCKKLAGGWWMVEWAKCIFVCVCVSVCESLLVAAGKQISRYT